MSKFQRMRFLFALILAGALSGSPILAQESTSTVPPTAAESGKDVVHALNNAFAKVFEIVAPSVVIIEVSKKNDGNEGFNFDDLFSPGQPDGNSPRRSPRFLNPVSEGSGFIVRPDGFIFTNYHVVEGAEHVDVKLKDGRELPAKVIGADDKTDIAVIKIEAKDLPVVQMGDSDAVRVGQFAFAIGAPFKLDYTFTYGVVSGKGRSKLISNGGYSIPDYIQTDASINPGNSGGPLCDIDGHVIGVNTLIYRMNRGLGFAIPINLARRVSEQLITSGRVSRPWLGIEIVGIEENEGLQRYFPELKKGVVINGIAPGTPASRSDLRAGDVIM